MKLIAAGDALIQKRIAPDFEGYAELAPYIESADVRFFNLETTLNEKGECFGSQFSGGTYLRTTPEVLPDLKRFGFNMTSFNNNHALDFSYEGFYSTLRAVNESGLVHAGVGMNMREASKPVYMDTDGGRVALIAVNTTFDAPMMAGEESSTVKGRPGINGIRVSETMVLPREELETVRRLAALTGVNLQKEILIKEGYVLAPAPDEEYFGNVRFVAGEQSGIRYEPNKKDVARLMASIKEAKENADYVMVSIHTHQLVGEFKETVPEYFESLCRRMIDEGADAVVGHGPHLLRPIEVYRGRPIFYSLGDFILQLYDVEVAPAEFYDKYGVSPKEPVRELLRVRSKDFTIGLMEDERMFLNVLPIWEAEEGKMTSLRLIPVLSNMKGEHQGLPRVCDPSLVIDYLGKMSQPYGVSLKAASDGLIDVFWS